MGSNPTPSAIFPGQRGFLRSPRRRFGASLKPSVRIGSAQGPHEKRSSALQRLLNAVSAAPRVDPERAPRPDEHGSRSAMRRSRGGSRRPSRRVPACTRAWTSRDSFSSPSLRSRAAEPAAITASTVSNRCSWFDGFVMSWACAVWVARVPGSTTSLSRVSGAGWVKPERPRRSRARVPGDPAPRAAHPAAGHRRALRFS